MDTNNTHNSTHKPSYSQALIGGGYHNKHYGESSSSSNSSSKRRYPDSDWPPAKRTKTSRYYEHDNNDYRRSTVNRSSSYHKERFHSYSQNNHSHREDSHHLSKRIASESSRSQYYSTGRKASSLKPCNTQRATPKQIRNNREICRLKNRECKLSVNEKIEKLKNIWEKDHEFFDSCNLSSFVHTVATLYKSAKSQTEKDRLKSLAKQAEIAEAAIDLIEKFKPQGLANTAWAFATLKVYDKGLLNAIAKATINLIEKFDPRQLSSTAWAFATLGIKDETLFNAIAKATIDIIEKFEPQNLANTAWAFATFGIKNEALFNAIAKEAIDLIEKFNTLDLSSIALAFATLNIYDKALFNAISETAFPLIKRFKPQELTNTAWAFATLNISHHQNLLIALTKAIAESFNDITCVDGLRQMMTFFEYYLLKHNNSQGYEELVNLLKTSKQALLAIHPKASFHESSSRLQENVAKHLQSIEGYTFKEEVNIYASGSEFTLISVDFMDEESKIVIEIDGPSHFASNSKKHYLGKNLLKNNLLQMLGYHVIRIPYFDWDYLKDDTEKTNYLNILIKSINSYIAA